MIAIKTKHGFEKTKNKLNRIKKFKFDFLKKYGEAGVEALKNNTPVDTGYTANSWYYKIEETTDEVKLIWSNKHVVNGVNIAIILQYGHGTRNGGYVEGIDYINPALEPIFKEINESIRREIER